MNLVMTARKRVKQIARAVIRHFQLDDHADSRRTGEEPLVLAMTHCHPTRVMLYAAAFQGGWKVHFVKSLREALETAHRQKPQAVFYDHAIGDRDWDHYCSALSRERIPFVLLAHKADDETFLLVLATGGYQTWGDPLTSEEIVKAVEFAKEVVGLARVPVM
jgi:DNA-binding response OmpR family regulator